MSDVPILKLRPDQLFLVYSVQNVLHFHRADSGEIFTDDYYDLPDLWTRLRVNNVMLYSFVRFVRITG